MDKRKKGHGELIIASSDPAKNLEFAEALNQVAFLCRRWEITNHVADHIAWVTVYDALLSDIGANGFCSICLSPRMLLPEMFTPERTDGGTGIKDVSAGSRKWTGFPSLIHNSMIFVVFPP